MREFDKARQLAPDSVMTNYYYGYGWLNLGMKSPLRAADAAQAKACFQKAAGSTEGKAKKTSEDALRGMEAAENWAKVSQQSAPAP